MYRKIHFVLVLLLIIGYVYYQYSEPVHHEHKRKHSERNEYQTSEPAVQSEGKVQGNMSKFGLPEYRTKLLILPNDGYISGYDVSIQDPRWVETRFFAVANPSTSPRPSGFSPDPRVPEEYRTDTHMWTSTGYDRGHMAPNEGIDLCYGRIAQSQTFLLTNVIPQTPQLNRGLWEALEKVISFNNGREYATRFNQVWVICGPIFSANPEKLSNGMVAIPDRCYKIILRINESGTPLALAFEMPQRIQMSRNQSELPQYLTSVKQIEEDTGIAFFPDMPSQQRRELENSRATQLW